MCGDAAMPQVVMVEVEQGRRLKERRKYGIYYEDDYDYLQHLKPRSGAAIVVEKGDDDDEDEEDDDDEDSFWQDQDDGEKSISSKATANAAKSSFTLPVDLLPNEPPTLAEVLDDGDGDANGDFYDAEIAEAIAAAEAGDADDDDSEGEGEIESDIGEVVEEGDIEDDFVALANAPDESGSRRRPLVGAGAAAASKRDIFSRFFDEADDEDEADEAASDEEEEVVVAKPTASVTTSRRGRPLTYHEEVIEDQFDRLLREFQRDSANAAAADCENPDNDDPGAVDDDCGSVMTKSLYQVLERHDKELASAAVTKETLDAGRLPASETLRILAASGSYGNEEDDEDASSLDTDDELSLWGPMAAGAAAPKLVVPLTSAGGDGVRSGRNVPVLLDIRDRRKAVGKEEGEDIAEEDEEDEEEEDNADSNEADSVATKDCHSAAAAAALAARLAGVTDKRERKRIVKEYQRARRQQKKQTRLCFGRAKQELNVATRNDPFQQGRVLKL